MMIMMVMMMMMMMMIMMMIMIIMMMDRFGELPEMVEGKFHCQHEDCLYTSTKTKVVMMILMR